MDKNIKIILGVAVAGVGGYLIYTQIKKAQAAKAAAAKPTITPVNTTVQNTGSGSGFPLKKGSNNSYVTELQTMLNTKGGFKLTVDGSFGPATEAALYQAIGLKSIDTLEQYTKLKEGVIAILAGPAFMSNEYITQTVKSWFSW